MAKRVFNFNPGPATLPLPVLEKVQGELLDYKGTGMSLMESSHRAAEYAEIHNGTISLFKELMGLKDGYKIGFLGGGASTQFAMVPMNFLKSGKTAAYVDTGAWSGKAIKEAKRIGNVDVVASSAGDKYTYIPDLSGIKLGNDTPYLHLTSNNTIYGTQYQNFPDPGSVPLVCDMSSDILSRRHDFNKFALIYAGAQKNLGPAGVTVVIIREDMLEKCADNIPLIFTYKTHAGKDWLYNTPPAFPVYVVKLVLEWIKGQGGLEAVEKVNKTKKDLIYGVIDANPDYFRGTVRPDSRSWMNITMRMPSEELEKKFIAEAKAAGFVGLKGHRDVGGIRVSLYNALPLAGAEGLAKFMETFRKNN